MQVLTSTYLSALLHGRVQVRSQNCGKRLLASSFLSVRMEKLGSQRDGIFVKFDI